MLLDLHPNLTLAMSADVYQDQHLLGVLGAVHQAEVAVLLVMDPNYSMMFRCNLN